MGSLAQKTKKLQANELKSLFARIPFQALEELKSNAKPDETNLSLIPIIDFSNPFTLVKSNEI